MTKANMDGVPKDEIYLAKMLQSARYRDEAGIYSFDYKDSAVSCCAVGAYVIDEPDRVPYCDVAYGNDNNDIVWTTTPTDTGADLGHTFKVAMTTEVEGD